MELPKFLLGDNTDFPDDIFVIHLDFPQFILNLKNDDLELLEEPEGLSEAEIQTELMRLIAEANAFYDREIERYDL
jgi:hypothetical protein